MAEEDELEGSASLNDSSNVDEEGFESGYITVEVLRIILLVCGLVANVTICCVLLHRKRLLKSFANFHLFNLALANLVFVIHITLFFLPQNHIESGNEVLGMLQLFVTFTTFTVTFALLAGISTNLYLNIVHPFKARNISWKHSGVFVILSWVYAGLCAGPLILLGFGCDNTNPDDEFRECEQAMRAETIASRTLYVMFAFMAPLVVIFASYGLVLRAMNARLKENISGRSQAIARSKKNIVKMIIVVALSYVLTWSPRLLWFVIDAYGITPTEQTIDEIYDDSADVEAAIHEWQVHMFCQMLTELITYSSFVLNPVIFAYYSQNFREGFKQLFQCRKKNYRLPLLRRLDQN